MDKNEELIHKLHKNLMRGFTKKIIESINSMQQPIVESKVDARKDDSRSIPVAKETPVPPEDHAGPDKINEIRNEVAATQSVEILSPDKQRELMEIVKEKSDEFERKLRGMESVDNNTIEAEAQKFKNELMDNVCKQLTEKKYALQNEN